MSVLMGLNRPLKSKTFAPNIRNAFPCDQCPKWCFSKTELLIHKTVHTGNIYNCPLCDKKFCFISVLQEHWKKTHGESVLATVKCCEIENNCPASLKPYKLQDLYTPAVSLLDDKLVYECEVCPEVFVTRKEFTEHMNNHIGPFPFTCEVCYKYFEDVPSLDFHMQCHAMDIYIQCPFCVKSFREKTLVYKHLHHVHHNYMYFECTMCPEIFPSCERLAQHVCTVVVG